MLGLRVRGRGGWDRTAPVAAPKSAFLWGSTPFLCARAKKWGGTGSRGRQLLPNKTAHTYRAQMRCRLVFALYVCADTLGGGSWPAMRFDPISLVLAQRNGVEPPKKSAFLPRWLHHSRERYCLGCLYSSSPDLGRGWCLSVGLYVCADFLGKSCRPLLPVPPHFFALAQRNGVEPQRNALKGAATGAVGSRPPLPRTRSPNIPADCVKLT